MVGAASAPRADRGLSHLVPQPAKRGTAVVGDFVQADTRLESDLVAVEEVIPVLRFVAVVDLLPVWPGHGIDRVGYGVSRALGPIAADGFLRYIDAQARRVGDAGVAALDDDRRPQELVLVQVQAGDGRPLRVRKGRWS